MTVERTPSVVDGACSSNPGLSRWIHSARVDAVISLLWVPFSALAVLTYRTPSALANVVGLTLLASFLHQPLTLGLIYGDPAQFAVAKRTFIWFPSGILVAILLLQRVSLPLVGAIAGLWNAEHTLMQRYGIVRIYDRKAGKGTNPVGVRSREKPMLLSWLVFALTFAAADPRTPKLLDRVELGATNEQGIRVLQSLRPWASVAVVLAVLLVIVTTVSWWRSEQLVQEGREPSEPRVSPKNRYLLSTAALFVVVLINPIVGLLGYVGAHTLEYVVIVHGALNRRYRGVGSNGGSVGRLVRSPLGTTGCLGVYLLMCLAALMIIKQALPGHLTNVTLLTIGGMHVFFDGFIWKLRHPIVAKSLAA